MAITVVTEAGGERVTWSIEVTWQQRREMIRSEGIMAVGDRNFVNPPLLAPAVLDCVTGWDREGEPSEEAIYSLPLGHVLDLVRQVGLWVLEGIMPGDGPPPAPPGAAPSPSVPEGATAVPFESTSRG